MQRNAGAARQARSNYNLVGTITDRRPDRGVAEVLETWSHVDKLVRDRGEEPLRSVAFIARLSGLPAKQIGHLRQVRNLCAHSADDGWPSQKDVDQALMTAYALRELVLGI
ncbi:hypothetical protein [Actinomadura roseirufa]|uniref:hypothetical protein n=1 Tax=Actinomadura roseirufa TaxID=2094049 RepID=UPI0010410730|nr:hypothetical protein [Actinomadura roseirufa]